MRWSEILKRVKVTAELEEGFVVRSQIRKHRVIMDLPPPLGDDKGPTPVDVMLASLAGCLGIVARYHAKKFNIEIKSLKIVIEGEYDTAGFEGEDVKAGMHKITAQVIVQSPNSEEELVNFFKFVEKHCPVGDTFTSNTPTELKVIKKG